MRFCAFDALLFFGDWAQYAARAARDAARSTINDAQNANTRGARKITSGETCKVSSKASSKTKARGVSPSSPSRTVSRKSFDSRWRSPAAKPRASAAFSHPPAAPASIAFATWTTFLSKRARNRQTRKEAPAARTWPATLRVGAAESNSQARGDAATESTSRAPISTVWWYSSGWMYPVPSTAQSARRMTNKTYVVSSAPTDQEGFFKRDRPVSPRDDRRRRLFFASPRVSELRARR